MRTHIMRAFGAVVAVGALTALGLVGAGTANAAAAAASAAPYGHRAATAQATGPYGAIAFSLAETVYAAGYGATQSAAEHNAKSNCVANGGLPGYACRVLLWFHNAAGAIALAGNGHAGLGWAAYDNLQRAKNNADQNAIKFCQTVSDGTPCTVAATYATPTVSASGTGGGVPAPIDTATPWNGYITYVHPAIIDQVQGSWTVPSNCGLVNNYGGLGEWVGLGGTQTGQTLVQAGVFSRCFAASQKNTIVWQVIPPMKQAEDTEISVSTGDKISASVTESYENYTLIVHDTTSGVSFRKTYTLPARSAIPYTAEWIVEDLTSEGYPLSPFSLITFTGCSYGPGGKDAPTTADSTVSETGNKTKVSAITNPGATFSVQYVHS